MICATASCLNSSLNLLLIMASLSQNGEEGVHDTRGHSKSALARGIALSASVPIIESSFGSWRLAKHLVQEREAKEEDLKPWLSEIAGVAFACLPS